MYLVAFVEDEHTVFLKTIIPSRKATKEAEGGGLQRLPGMDVLWMETKTADLADAAFPDKMLGGAAPPDREALSDPQSARAALPDGRSANIITAAGEVRKPPDHLARNRRRFPGGAFASLPPAGRFSTGRRTHMRLHAALVLTGVLLFGLSPSTARADTIRLLDYSEHLYASALVFGPSASFALYDEDRQVNAANSASAAAAFASTSAAATSELTSFLSGDLHRLAASARTAAAVEGPEGLSQSTADVWFSFEIDATHTFDFRGEFSRSGLFGGWQAQLVGLPEDPGQPWRVRFFGSSNTGSDQQLRFRGGLDPGRYALFVRAHASGDTVSNEVLTGAGRYDFTYEMDPVPEPGSLLLMGSGALGLVARVRRRGRAKAL